MKRIIKIISCLLLATAFTTFAIGQNNAIFKGGTADGWISQNSVQTSANIFKGGIGDGWNTRNYVQSSNNIFRGGIGDGWSSLNYIQAGTNIFKGGIGDGWNTNNYVQSSINIFKGGIGDGWSSLPLSNDARLLNLTISAGTLAPVFDSAVINYTASVPFSVASIDVTPTASDINASIKINGVIVTSGTANNVALSVGSNTITTLVTAPDGRTTKTYTITITRSAGAPTVVTTAETSVSITSATLNGTVNGNGATTTVTFEYGTSPTLAGATIVTATTNGTVNAGSGTVSSSVNITGLTAGTTYYFRIVGINSAGSSNGSILSFTATALSNNANLSNLTISAGTLTPAFASGTISYTASVANSITSVDVTPTVSNANATITVNGVTTASGTARNVVLNVGSNTITTIITAQDGTTKTYTITMTRASIVLPITLIDFKAVKNGNHTLLTWETASEYNNAYFIIERSVDGVNMSGILRVDSKGNSNVKQSYTTIDYTPFGGTNYYRLKQVDIDGKFSYSSVRSVNFSAGVGQVLNIYPNPAQDFIKLDLPRNFYNKTAVINIKDASGRIVKHWVVNGIQPNSLQLFIAELPAAVYFVQVIAGGEVVTAKITKE